MAQKQPIEAIETLSEFALHKTREEYEAKTGNPPPVWDPDFKEKQWEDPDAEKKVRFRLPDGTGVVVYDRVIFEPYKTDANGKPVVEGLTMTVAEASRVNIPPKGTGQTNIPGTGRPPVPFPMKALGANQVLIMQGPMAHPVVRNLDVPLSEGGTGFSEDDRATLQAIAAKVGAV